MVFQTIVPQEDAHPDVTAVQTFGDFMGFNLISYARMGFSMDKGNGMTNPSSLAIAA
jgi:hypothetical protein